MLRKMTFEFIKANRDFQINGLPIELAASLDSPNLDSYLDNSVLQMGEDAWGLLFSVIPFVLKFNITIIDIDTS